MRLRSLLVVGLDKNTVGHRVSVVSILAKPILSENPALKARVFVPCLEHQNAPHEVFMIAPAGLMLLPKTLHRAVIEQPLLFNAGR